jgi:hypothetical protein
MDGARCRISAGYGWGNQESKKWDREWEPRALIDTNVRTKYLLEYNYVRTLTAIARGERN